MEQPAIEPLYTTPNVNESVSLFVGQGRVDCEGRALTGDLRVALSWAPTPRLAFELRKEGFHGISSTGPVQVSFAKPQAVTVSGYITQATETVATSSPVTILTGLIEPLTIESPGALTRAVFHLPNFINFRGAPIVRPIASGTRYSLGRLTFSFDGWEIDLDSLLDDAEHRAAAHAGGHLLTHVGEVQRSNGESFTSSQLRDLLYLLGICFSFVRGRWASPCLAVGFNGQGQVSEQWNIPHIQALGLESTWFPEDHAKGAMDRLAEGMWRRWQDADIQESLELAVSWFIEGNSQEDLRARVAIAQMGLELIGWLLLVRDANVLSPRGFERLDAHDAVRLTLGWTQGTADIPALFVGLAGLARQQQPGLDGPEAFTRIRNRIVHPPKGSGSASASSLDAISDAGELGLWYLELALLNYVGYMGPYRNRTLRGATMPVPWDV